MAPRPEATDEAGIHAVERELAMLVRRTRSASRRMAEEVHRGVDAAAYSLLVRLADAGESRPSDLAEHFGVGKPTVGRQLACLEQLGLVARRPDPDDGRAHILGLTALGEGWVATQRERRQTALGARFAAWSDEDLTALARTLARLNDALR
ncbi:MarR family winged helix-turn-helix transcriptional regulator [Luteimicrobium sp. NPDC057192]|uniref:MarR family winged helix-turn-helix transcriptional regulator n=1 Tax=Luteimicrobium sp. NPDC057192 TaxID=3346042 RepID=UPI00362AE681